MLNFPRTPTDIATDEALRRRAIFVGLIVVFCCGNLFGPTLLGHGGILWESGGSYAVTTALGALAAEVILLAIWCALGTQAIKMRLPLCLSLAIVAACTYILGLQIPDDDLPLEVAIIVVVAASVFFACMLVPFWGLRMYAQRHIVAHHEAPDDQSRSGQFGVRHLLTMTGCVAALLVLVKHSFPADSNELGIPHWGQFIAGALTYMVLSGCLAVPCVWLTLSSQHRSFWAISLPAVLLLGPMIASVSIQFVYGADSDWWELLFHILSFGAGLVATILSVLYLLGTLCGLRLSAMKAD